jgi:hypothetical protein
VACCSSLRLPLGLDLRSDVENLPGRQDHDGKNDRDEQVAVIIHRAVSGPLSRRRGGAAVSWLACANADETSAHKASKGARSTFGVETIT